MFSIEERTEGANSPAGSNYGGEAISTGKVMKKGPWTAAEDALLMEYVKKNGEGNWNSVQRITGLARCGKSCRLRWANHLRPNLKKGAFTPHEERQIIELHAKFGNKWARMASQLPGRTDNEIKNFWNTRVKRRLRQGLPLYPPEIRPSVVSNPPTPASYAFVHPAPATIFQKHANWFGSSEPVFFVPAPSPPPVLYSPISQFSKPTQNLPIKTELPSDQISPLKTEQIAVSGFLDDLLKEAQMIAGIKYQNREDKFRDTTFVHSPADARPSGEGEDDAAAMNVDISDLLVSFPFSSDWCANSDDCSNCQSSGVTDDGSGLSLPPPAIFSGADDTSSPSWSYFPRLC